VWSSRHPPPLPWPAMVPAAAGAHTPAGGAGAAAAAALPAALPAAPLAAVVPATPAAPAALVLAVPAYTQKSGSSNVWEFMHPLDEPQSCDAKCSSAKCKGKLHTFICTTCLAALGDGHWQECLYGMEGGVMSTSNFNGHAKRSRHHLNASAPMALAGDAVEKAKRQVKASTPKLSLKGFVETRASAYQRMLRRCLLLRPALQMEASESNGKNEVRMSVNII